MCQKLTEQYLKDLTQEFDVQTVFILSLTKKGIFDLGDLGLCTNLTHLDLSWNKLSSVMTLRTVTCLESLDLSSNRLSALSGLEHLEALNSLNVAGNFLNSLDCLLPLTKLEKLQVFWLKDEENNLTNPVYDADVTVNDKVLKMLPKLQQLNGESQSTAGREFKQLYTEVHDVMKKEHQQEFQMLHDNWKPSTIEDPAFARVGFEKNDVYEKTYNIASKCEELSQITHRLAAELQKSLPK